MLSNPAQGEQRGRFHIQTPCSLEDGTTGDVTTRFASVLSDVGVMPEEAAWQVLVIACGDREPAHVRLDQVVLVLLEYEADRGLVDQHLLSCRVVLVA